MDSTNDYLIEFKQHQNKEKKINQKSLIYLLTFLFTLHFTPATYVESSFLEKIVGNNNVGFIFSLASVITIITLAIVRKLVRKIGNYKTFYNALIIEFISLFVLSISLFVKSSLFWNIILIAFFMTGFIARSIAFFNFDIFTEHLSKDNDTGSIRGSFLTFENFAFVIGPLFSGIIINNDNDIAKVFALGCILLLPVIYIARKYFKDFQDPEYKNYHFLETFLYVLKKSDLRRIFICNFLLFLFYSWMIIYTPIYLHDYIGFDLGQVSIIIAIALIPFLLLQFYLGKLADTKYGEKEILTTGLIITGLSTMLIFYIPFKIFILWAMILFITRIGASMIETMVETYLFKKVNEKSIDIISMYRAVRPMAYITGPVLASILLNFIDLKYLFLILGIFMISGVFASLKINDTL